MSWRKLIYTNQLSRVSSLPHARLVKAPVRRYFTSSSLQDTSRAVEDITDEPAGWAGPPPHAKWDGSSPVISDPWRSSTPRKAPFQRAPNVFKGLDRVTNIQQLKYVIDKNLASKENASQLLSHMSALRLAFLRLQAECSPMSLVIVLNAILIRIRRFGVVPDQPTLYFGLGLAARTGSLDVVSHYLHAVEFQYEKRKGSSRGPAAKSLLHYLRYQSPEGPNYGRAMLEILTGWQNNGVAQPGEVRKPSVFELLKGLPPPRWKVYLMLLREYGGKVALNAAWTELRSHQDKEFLVRTFVHSYFTIEEPEKAWQVVLESGLRAEAIEPYTWSLLLASPEYLTGAVPGIYASITEECERQLLEIESALEVQWTGGENGIHKPLPSVSVDSDDYGGRSSIKR